VNPDPSHGFFAVAVVGQLSVEEDGGKIRPLSSKGHLLYL
jgi:hypothetical protein